AAPGRSIRYPEHASGRRRVSGRNCYRCSDVFRRSVQSSVLAAISAGRTRWAVWYWLPILPGSISNRRGVSVVCTDLGGRAGAESLLAGVELARGQHTSAEVTETSE